MNNENNSTNSFVISDGIGQIVEPTAVASISAASSSAEGPSTGPSPNPSDYANQVNGDSGDNRLNAIAAGSWLDGGAGDDRFLGSGGDDYIRAGSGNDFAIGGGGNDIFEFGSGTTFLGVLDFVIGEDKIALSGGLTYSDLSKTGSSGGVIFSTSGGDKLKLKNIDDLDESHFFMLGATVPGPSTPNGTSPKPTDYSNQVNGDSGDNRLNAIAAGSWLDGGAGNDRFLGSSGDDYIKAGSGQDFALGGGGNDIFEFGAGVGFLGVLDFVVGEDKIALTGGLTYADLSQSGSSGSVIFSTSGGDQIKLKNVQDLDESHFITLGATAPGPTNPGPTNPGPANTDPIGRDETYSVSFGTTLNVATASGVLANDTDQDGDTLAANLSTQASNGQVTLRSNGSFDYIPDNGFSGSDSFDYTISDGNGGTATATASINVAAGPSGPGPTTGPAPQPSDYANQVSGDAGNNRLNATAAGSWLDGGAGDDRFIGSSGDDYFRAGSGKDYALGGGGNDIFEFGASVGLLGVLDFAIGEDKIALTGGMTYSDLSKSASSGSVIFSTSGGDKLKLKNVQDLDESHFFTLGATTPGPTNPGPTNPGPTNPGPTNTDPVGRDESYTTSFGTTLNVSSTTGVLANDTDQDGDSLTATLSSPASNGNVTLRSNGSFDYNPDIGFSGIDSFDYTISDGNGGTVTAAASIDVAAGPTGPGPSPSSKEFTIVMTSGQSVAAGASNWLAREIFTANAFDEDRALMARYQSGNFVGIEGLREINFETLGSSMIRHLLSRYDDAELTSPNFLHTNSAFGGSSVTDFLNGANDVYATVAQGTNATNSGDHFSVARTDGGFDHYIDEGGTALFTRSTTRKPLYDELIENFINAIDGAQSLGHTISDTFMFNWLQGQADSQLGGAKYGYSYHLELLISKFEKGIEAHLGRDIDIVTSISQIRGYGPKEISFEQLDVALQMDGAHLGIVEYEFQASEPSTPGRDYTHFSNEGYYLAGAQLGYRFFDALQGTENAPILIESVTRGGPNELLVNFSGVDGSLVNDPSIYDPANSFVVPSHFGFGIYEGRFRPSENYKIMSSSIVDADTVSLVFNQEPVDGLRLNLGRTGETLIDPSVSLQGRDFGGTTLRSSDTSAILPPEQGLLDEQFVYEYAPIQAYDLLFA